jgi:CRISPR-associated endonuclease/helicase Cas3
MDTKALHPAAHTPRVPGGEWHDLATHLHATAAKAKARADKFGAGNLAYLAGLWHDLGKYNPAFQQYLIDSHEGREVTSTLHAIYGALWAAGQGLPELEQVIAGHHTGMPSLADIDNAFSDPAIRLTYENVMTVAPEVEDAISTPKVSRDLRGEMLLRMVFSCLVDADYVDTERHFDPERAAMRVPPSRPGDLLPLLLVDQERIMLGKVGAVNAVRREVYGHCLSTATESPGVYRLVAPTGAGKTRSALAFGLRHAVEHHLERVVFAVPYLSITDQVAHVARSIFGAENVLEHHSGILTREPSFESKLAVQNWSAALIVTTTVQLLESLLSNRPSRCRKLHNIANSVIILDEVQTLPITLLQPIVSVLQELVDRYGCSVVLSTATQPALTGQFRYLQGFGMVRDIVGPEKAREHFQKLRRVSYEVRPDGWSWQRVAHELRQEGRAMAVVNTRVDAADLCDQVGGDALHLSASMCGAHRKDVLSEVRSRLAQDQACLLISTQVVEAGVDLDFDCVFRAFGPLDRIVQAAGRCNREGRLQEGRVVVFAASDGSLPPGEYRTATHLARNTLRRGIDLHDPGVWDRYFRRLYQGVDTDANHVQPLRSQFNYPEVARRFRLIDDGQQDVIVAYDNRARTLIARIRAEGELRRGDLKRLQPYAVGLYPRDFDKSAADREEIAEGVWVWNGQYDDKKGVIIDQ